MAKVKTRKYNWRDLVEKAAGPQPAVAAYVFGGRTFRASGTRPYGPKR